MYRIIKGLFILITILPSIASIAQSKKTKPGGELYFSWGYNKEWYTKSSLHVNQPALGNNYTLRNFKAHDRPGWDNRLLSKPITIPQYNARLGYFFNPEKGWGVEINFDHTKYIIQDDQDLNLRGTFAGAPVDTVVNFSEANGSYYFLNNGANFVMLNLVKRCKLYETNDENLRIDFLGKAGAGPVIPHVENSLFGEQNNSGFQFGGWNLGVEAGLKASFFKYGFLEYTNKLSYARYSNLKVYEGKAKHSFGTYQMILSLGVNVPIGKKQVPAS